MRILLAHIAALLAGLLAIYVGQTYCDMEYMVAPQLFGRNIVSSLGCLIILAVPLHVTARCLQRVGVEPFSIALICIAALSGAYYIHVSSNIVYTNDWDDHLLRVRWTQFNWSRPYGIPWNHEHHHPPLYYYAAGLAYRFSMWSMFIPVLTAVRMVSWLSYLAFNSFNLLTLRRAGFSPATYRICAALLILWPLGVPMSGKINNEPIFYAFYAAAFYYGICWYQDNKPRQLMLAVILAAVALTARSTSITLFTVLFFYVMIAWDRGYVKLTSFFRWRWVLIGLFVVFAFLTNIGDIIQDRFSMWRVHEHWGYERGDDYPLHHFLKFEPSYYFKIPFNNWSGRQSVWEFLLKTSLYGENGWQHWQMARALNVLVLAIVLYAFLPFLFVRRREWRGLRPYALGLIIPIIYLLIFTWWKHSLQNHDARHIYGALPCFVIWFGFSHQHWVRKNLAGFRKLGTVLVWSFVVLGQVFYFGNIR